jgi:hypothetical protein
VGTLDADKLQRIANLAKRLTSQVGNCDPVVVSSENAQLRKKDAELQGIIIIDRSDLETLLALVKSGEFEKAKRKFE